MPQHDVVSWNTLLNCVFQQEPIERAIEFFDRMPRRDLVSWNSLIQAFTQNGQELDAGFVFGRMPQRSALSWNVTIQAFGSKGHLEEARSLFDRMPEPDVVAGNAMINAYALHGNLLEAVEVFDQMGDLNVISHTSMMIAYIQHGQLYHAREFFDSMSEKSVVTWNAMIQAYAQSGEMQRAEELFREMPTRDVISCNAMLTGLAAQSGGGGRALEIFGRMPQRSVSSWNAIFKVFAHRGDLMQAKLVFYEMPHRDVFSWNALIALLSSATTATSTDHRFARMLYDRIPLRSVVSYNTLLQLLTPDAAGKLFLEMPEKDHVSWTAMICAYTQHGRLVEAKATFDQSPKRNVVSWTAMITGYASNAKVRDAEVVYSKMSQHSLVTFNSIVAALAAQSRSLTAARKMVEELPIRDAVTWNALLAGYAQVGRFDHAKNIFDRLPEWDMLGFNVMIQAYSISGEVERARDAFDESPERDVVSWNTMINAYVQNERGKDAVELFCFMDLEGMKPDITSFVCVVDAAADLAAIAIARAIHAVVSESGFTSNVVLNTALINMYGKCGRVEIARGIFDSSGVATDVDTVTWNAMIATYAQNGRGQEAVDLFLEMLLDGRNPESITFVNVLNGCSHAGQQEDGYRYFGSMVVDHGLTPILHHYVCVVDSLGRTGRLDEAEELMNAMPFEPNVVVLTTLLGACKSHNDLGRATRVGRLLMGMESDCLAVPYVLLSNMHVAAGDRRSVRKVSIDKVHVFAAAALMRDVGYTVAVSECGEGAYPGISG